MTINAYLLKPRAKRIFLAEIDADGGTIYLASAPYLTEPGDTPANQPYEPVIESIPRLSRQIQELRGGRSMASHGDLVLSWYRIDSGAANLYVEVLRARAVRIYVTGPRNLVSRADALLVFKGVVVSCAGDADGRFTLRLGDKKASFEKIAFPPNRYNIAVTPNIPAALDGQPKPVVEGKCLNITPRLINTSGLVYQVHDTAVSALDAVDAVYSNGVVVPDTSYTVSATVGTFTLGATLPGTITADAIASALPATSVEATLEGLVTVYGGLAAGSSTFTGFEPFTVIGLYAFEQTDLASVLTAICQGHFAWWGFDRSGNLQARVLTPPAVTPDYTIDDTTRLGATTWEDYPDIIYSQPMTYYPNFTRIGSPAGAVTADQAAWLNDDGLHLTVTDTGILALYPDAIVAEPLNTYCHTVGPTTATGNAVLALLGTQRRVVRCRTVQRDPPIELGDTVALNSDIDTFIGIFNTNYIVIGVTDVWDAETPVVDLELLG